MIAQPDEPFHSHFNEEPTPQQEATLATGGADLQLWNQFKAGDRQAFARIYQQYAKVLTQYGLKLIRDKELVRDVIQDLFVQVWDSKERLGEVRSIRSYLFASVRREIGKRVQRLHLFVDDTSLDAEFGSEDSVESQLIQGQYAAEMHEKLSLEIHKLPARQQEAIFLKYYCELDFSQVAQVMSITTRAVYKLIYKAIDQLQKGLRLYSILLPLVLHSFLG